MQNIFLKRAANLGGSFIFKKKNDGGIAIN